MRRYSLFNLTIGSLVVVGVAAALAQTGVSKRSDQQLIASAMAAAPASLSREATVVVLSGDSTKRTLRTGANGWTCVPGDPSAPGDDPMCADPNGWQWLQALMEHRPPKDQTGVIYMLSSSAAASNTDPFAIAPPAGRKWILTGPALMIVGPAVRQLPGYAGGPEPDTRRPYVMWAGTAYEHLMVPTR